MLWIWQRLNKCAEDLGDSFWVSYWPMVKLLLTPLGGDDAAFWSQTLNMLQWGYYTEVHLSYCCTVTLYSLCLFLDYGGHMVRGATVPGQECLNSCRLHRRSSSLLQARSLNLEIQSSMWQEPLTSSVSFITAPFLSALLLFLIKKHEHTVTLD